MEEIGSEVSHKIRAAIKAKLIELGAYVDDELPDYIMVMVANKRTRAQMDEDLHLFLSSNTKIFTSWLHTVLQKLQEVTVASFESKKESDSKKPSKRKKSEEATQSGQSSEEESEKVKKRPKKHKETKKSKKNKYRNKEKEKEKEKDKDKDKAKCKKSEKEGSKEKGKEEEKRVDEESESKEKGKSKQVQLNEVVGKAILGDLKKNKKLKSDKQESSSESGSSSEDETNVEKSARENGNGEAEGRRGIEKSSESENDRRVLPDADKQGVVTVIEDDAVNAEENIVGKDSEGQKNKKEVVEDEFNIEPLKPAEEESETKYRESEETKDKKEAESGAQEEKTISAPTEELLKEHDKIQSQQLKGEESSSRRNKPGTDSEESLSPEEIRKQLLLSRAKKKLEESKKAERMQSNSPDVLIMEEISGTGGRQKDLMSEASRQLEIRSTHSDGKESSRQNSLRRSRPSSSHRDRSQSAERSPYRKGGGGHRSVQSGRRSPNEERKKMSLIKSKSSFQRDREKEKEKEGEKKNPIAEKKRNVIKISETLEKERSLGGRKESETKTKEKEEIRPKKRSISSRVVTIPAPEAPEIPSIVKVRPREFVSKDKQANKALILKAVADAEKSVATAQVRPEVVPEPKKEALYTKNFREKRYEKLAITLSNIRRSPDPRDRLNRRISVDSEKSDKSRPKRGSSDVSEGVRAKSDLLSKKVSKSEDQFISSKTTMEKNDKYIRCWLEGVEKAVKDDEMLNPSEMEDFVHSNLTDEENEAGDKEDDKNRKRKSTDPSADSSAKALKLSDKEIANLRVIPDAGVKPEGPQIVVTLDGLDTKAIKDLILKNKESSGRPLLSSGRKAEKVSEVAREESTTESRKTGFEKMSDRFGRLNKATEGEDAGKRSEDKSWKRETGDSDKKKAATESKNRQLIAQLSEKFGKIDREFESRKRKRPDEDRRYQYDSRRGEKEEGDRNGRYRKSERRSFGFYRRS